MSGRESKSCRPTILHTRATAVLDNLAAYSECSVEPNTPPPSANWDSHTAAKTRARTNLQNAIDALNMALIIDQDDHGIPTCTELDGIEAGTIRRWVELSRLLSQLCTALSHDPTLNTKAKLVEWGREETEFLELRQALEKGQWPK